MGGSRGDYNVDVVLRKAVSEDREKVIEVESKSTPNLSYLPEVFDSFVSDEVGEFIVAEVDGEVVACGKFTIVPDGSAWLETLRVVPEYQGIGIGKRFYERFFEIARRQGVETMRMYTGIRNIVSRGLAERFGFQLAATYRGAWMPCNLEKGGTPIGSFRMVSDPTKATSILMPYQERWGKFLVMNRTFYALTPNLCESLALNGMIYEDVESDSTIVLGARFMPEKALYIGLFGGNVNSCLGFAAQECSDRGVKRLSCLFQVSAVDLQDILTLHGFRLEASDFLVMETHISK